MEEALFEKVQKEIWMLRHKSSYRYLIHYNSWAREIKAVTFGDDRLFIGFLWIKELSKKAQYPTTNFLLTWEVA